MTSNQMRANPIQYKTKLITIFFILSLASLLFAKEEELSELQNQARQYRQEGLNFQRSGDLNSALSLYQKAIELDPAYAVAFNDLGIIYEANGQSERAEEAYLKCLQLDPGYLAAYTNLALLYENKRDIKKAAIYWEKRAKLGAADDPWSLKAKNRLEDIRLVTSETPYRDAREQEVIGLINEVSAKKEHLQEDNRELAKEYFKRAKLRFKKGDNVTAWKLANDARHLDPSCEEIEQFIRKLQARLLSR